MYVLTQGSLSTKEHVPPGQMWGFQSLDPSPIYGSDSSGFSAPMKRQRFDEPWVRCGITRTKGVKKGCCGAQAGNGGVADRGSVGELDDIRLFFSESPSHRRGSRSHKDTNDIRLHHPAQGSFPLVVSCILLV